MRSRDHVHIVSTITNRQRRLVLVPCTHHLYNLCLLFGTDTTGKDDVCSFTQVNELFYEVFILLDCCKGLTRDHNCVITRLLCHTLLAQSFDYLYSRACRGNLREHEHVHVLMEQLARMTNIDGCLNFVACQHPKLDTSSLYIIDCLANLVL